MTTVTDERKEAFQMTLVPLNWYQVGEQPPAPICILDNEPIEKLDEFTEQVDAGGIASGFYYEGSLYICPKCGHVHYVVNHTDFMVGPVTMQWGM